MMYFLLVVGFAAGFLLVFGLNLFATDVSEVQKTRLRERLAEEQRLHQLERARVSMQYRDLYELAAEEAESMRSGQTWLTRLGHWLEQSGLRMSPWRLVGTSLFVAAVAAVVVGLLSRQVLWTVFLSLTAGSLPPLGVFLARTRRLARLQSQLPDAFDMMSRTMKAGQTITQAFQSVADEGSAPLCEEFGYCYEQQNLGMTPEAALRDLSVRTGVIEIKIFVLAVMIHRQTGGNLSELLEKLSKVIRERYRIKGVIKALTAEGHFQAIILFLLPFIVFGAMLVLNRPYALELFQYPGLIMLSVALMTAGMVWMHRIINFDF